MNPRPKVNENISYGKLNSKGNSVNKRNWKLSAVAAPHPMKVPLLLNNKYFY